MKLKKEKFKPNQKKERRRHREKDKKEKKEKKLRRESRRHITHKVREKEPIYEGPASPSPPQKVKAPERLVSSAISEISKKTRQKPQMKQQEAVNRENFQQEPPGKKNRHHATRVPRMRNMLVAAAQESALSSQQKRPKQNAKKISKGSGGRIVEIRTEIHKKDFSGPGATGLETQSKRRRIEVSSLKPTSDKSLVSSEQDREVELKEEAKVETKIIRQIEYVPKPVSPEFFAQYPGMFPPPSMMWPGYAPYFPPGGRGRGRGRNQKWVRDGAAIPKTRKIPSAAVPSHTPFSSSNNFSLQATKSSSQNSTNSVHKKWIRNLDINSSSSNHHSI
mmetsp:Transcript_22332/g.28983  ORF Transcript_22332/g.28983 Transcript_22332/m.28983 type:complete len:334 (+) Transcript_22332:418-1419(+)